MDDKKAHSIEFAFSLPSELWLAIFKKFHPVYDDLFLLSVVCKSWHSLIITKPDPSLWKNIAVRNVRNCCLKNILLLRFKAILKRFGGHVKLISAYLQFSELSFLVKSYFNKGLAVLKIS